MVSTIIGVQASYSRHRREGEGLHGPDRVLEIGPIQIKTGQRLARQAALEAPLFLLGLLVVQVMALAALWAADGLRASSLGRVDPCDQVPWSSWPSRPAPR